MPYLSFTVYFDGNHEVKRIVAHAEWCDYRCKDCRHNDLCEKVYNAIANATGYFEKKK